MIFSLFHKKQKLCTLKVSLNTNLFQCTFPMDIGNMCAVTGSVMNLKKLSSHFYADVRRIVDTALSIIVARLGYYQIFLISLSTISVRVSKTQPYSVFNTLTAQLRNFRNSQLLTFYRTSPRKCLYCTIVFIIFRRSITMPERGLYNFEIVINTAEKMHVQTIADSTPTQWRNNWDGWRRISSGLQGSNGALLEK